MPINKHVIAIIILCTSVSFYVLKVSRALTYKQSSFRPLLLPSTKLPKTKSTGVSSISQIRLVSATLLTLHRHCSLVGLGSSKGMQRMLVDVT